MSFEETDHDPKVNEDQLEETSKVEDSRAAEVCPSSTTSSSSLSFSYTDYSEFDEADIDKFIGENSIGTKKNVTEKESRKRTKSRSGFRGGVKEPFPLILHKMLASVQESGLSNIISWSTHGRAFKVYKSEAFVNVVLHRFFKQTKITSFHRQLNLYGFRRILKGADSGAYFHEMFLRGKPFLCRAMIRVKVKGQFHPRHSEVEPDFYQMKKLPELKAGDFENIRAIESRFEHFNQSSLQNHNSIAASQFPVYFPNWSWNNNPADHSHQNHSNNHDSRMSLMIPDTFASQNEYHKHHSHPQQSTQTDNMLTQSQENVPKQKSSDFFNCHHPLPHQPSSYSASTMNPYYYYATEANTHYTQNPYWNNHEYQWNQSSPQPSQDNTNQQTDFNYSQNSDHNHQKYDQYSGSTTQKFHESLAPDTSSTDIDTVSWSPIKLKSYTKDR